MIEGKRRAHGPRQAAVEATLRPPLPYKQNGTTLLGDLTYEYDKAGNRTKIGGSWARTGMPEPLTATSYDANNRQLTFGDKTLAYDDNGNLQSITDSNGTTLYQWNARNQLIGISGPNVNASFVYDGAGRRAKKIVNANVAEFLYDIVNPVQESSDLGIQANFLAGLGIDEYFAHADLTSGVTRSLLMDALGNVVALADDFGAVQTENSYEPFGKTSWSGALNNSAFQYTGRENDTLGLYYYRARYYDSGLQRFISEDSEFDALDLNLYAYVANNPTTWLDPEGHAKQRLPRTVECLMYKARYELYCRGSACEGNDSCLMFLLKIAIKRACIAAAEQLSSKCYPGNPHPGHEEQLQSQRSGLKICETLLDKCTTCPAK